MTACIAEACAAGVRETKACRVVGISPRNLQRWREAGEVKADVPRQAAGQRESANKLSHDERRQILAIANEPEFARMPPSQIVPILADRGCYVASESSFYRVLHSDNGSPMKGVCAALEAGLFAAVLLENEVHAVMSGVCSTAVFAYVSMQT